MIWLAQYPASADGIPYFGKIGLAMLGLGVTLAICWRLLRDISIDRSSDAAIDEVNARFGELANIAVDLFWYTDVQGHVRSAGGRMLQQLVADESDLMGRHYLDLVNLEEAEMQKMFRALEQLEPYSDIQSVFRDHNGAQYVFSLCATPRFDSKGQITGYLGVGTNVTERVAVQEKLKHLADHDALTGLANRRAFSTWITRDISGSEHLGLFAIDLDDFKGINDTYGHDIGDEILCQVAERLRSVLRRTDWAARLGGDEFVFVSPDLESEADARRIAKRVSTALGQTYQIDTLELSVRASIGIAISPDHGNVPERLMKCADLALYEAKSSNKGRFVLFQDTRAAPYYSPS